MMLQLRIQHWGLLWYSPPLPHSGGEGEGGCDGGVPSAAVSFQFFLCNSYIPL